jgi:hypothetical protein
MAQSVVDGSVDEDVSSELMVVLRAVARHTEELRAAESILTTLADVIAGRVVEVHEGYVVLRRLVGPPTAVPRWMALAARRERVGELLALVLDRLDTTSAVVEAVPAIETDDRRAGRGFSPFGRGDSQVTMLTAHDEKLLSGRPAQLQILVPVLIDP